MEASRRHRVGLWALVPGLLIFAVRSLLEWAGTDPSEVAGLDPATGLGGALSLVGLLVAAQARPRMAVLLGVATALFGHAVLSRLAPDVSAGFVYFGTALLVSDRRAVPLVAGLVAFTGTLVRLEVAAGHAFVAGGALLLAVAVLHRSLEPADT